MSTAIEAARAKTKGKTFLKQILNAYGEIDSVEASANAISDWNRRKKEAIENGSWVWKDSTVTHAMPRTKVDANKVQVELASLTSFTSELNGIVHHPATTSYQEEKIESKKACAWSAVVDGKFYTCTNELHTDMELSLRRCNWHASECRNLGHASATPKLIPQPNDEGLCLACYDKKRTSLPKHKRVPPSFPQLSIPGVHRAEAQKIQAQVATKAKVAPATQKTFGRSSKCTWQGHKPGQKSIRPYICRRVVLLHPVYETYLACCGFHQTRCVRTRKGVECPDIVLLNAYGLCHNHYEAYMTTLSYEARHADKAVQSPFDAPDVVLDGGDKHKDVASHPLAPKYPPPAALSSGPSSSQPPPTSFLRGQLLSLVGTWLQSTPLPSLWWQINYLRQGPRIATRIQCIFRGNRARRRVRRMQLETYAKKRTAAALLMQKHWRSKMASRRVTAYRHLLVQTSVRLQAVARGFLARASVRHTRCWRRLCAVVGVFLTVHRALTILHWRVDVRRGLQSCSDHDRLAAILRFQRRFAASVIVRAARAYLSRQRAKAVAGALKFKSFMSAVVIQRAWKRYRRLQMLQTRFNAAKRIQARTRGALTRCLWAADPGITSMVHWVNPRTGVAYVRYQLDGAPSPSYSVVRRTLRRDVAARLLQQYFRGFLGRLIANTMWANMEKRWQWIDPTQDRAALRALVPSANYHEDHAHHMRPIYNLPAPFRGYAYEFQGVLDLLDDRSSHRCSPLPRRVPPLSIVTDMEPPPSLAAPSMELAPTQSVIASSHLKAAVGITSTMALFPVGAIVYVRLGGGRRHPARITRAHREADTFDVAFLPGLVSMRGIAIPDAREIHASRLQYDAPTPTSPTLTSRIHTEQQRLQRLSTKKKSFGRPPKPKAVEPYPSEAARFHDIATTIRTSYDILLADRAAWHQLVFDHRDFLNRYWLRLVHDIECGTWTDPDESCPLEGMILPLPHVAKQLRAKLLAFGFESTPTASASPMPHCEPPPKQIRNTTTTCVDDMHVLFAHDDSRDNQTTGLDATHETTTRDDLSTPNPAHLALADIHKLVYHLKSLPRHGGKDHVIQVTTRNVRTFVCSHPACGRCFSTREGARLHKALHANKMRLVGANPLVDQYMHKHWPPESPWRDENQATVKGTASGYHCSVCDKSFPTKRDVAKHASATHGHEEPQERASTTNANLIWLGASTPIKDVTARFPELRRRHVCPTCTHKIPQPDMVCRLYPSVCIFSASALIFTTDFPTFAPQFTVSCSACGRLGDDSVDGHTHALYMRLHALCRDKRGMDWALGYFYNPPPTAPSLGEALLLGYDYVYELLLQETLVAVPLSQCNGYAMVHSCSRNYFHRKVKTGRDVERFCRQLRPSSSSRGTATTPITPSRTRRSQHTA
ncbi:Aste57867_18768 [Aphanomyces stellatus]|uniref:Aste57867_18768 protein n=1 Tax=Aphanomyces stellatus TaxID=120398 RepID=A0A485LAY4_9STRA|nr:hypothetical protein As57867_018704 [Aphanomyces stellatus]VFT95502.1 Aste57867_18768 [Aphanomyces stellatus]